jgi:mannosyl-3-phosphoglycerate phosphatase
MKKLIIFTDLDGTLLDYYTYSFDAAMPALQLIKERNIPLIICSSKTRKEIEHYRIKLSNRDPFITENGGGIFIPKNYFRFQISDSEFKAKKNADYYLIKLGVKYSDLRKALSQLRSEGFRVRGFGDMSAGEIRDLTNMTLEEAEMAKDRDFDEPFIFQGNNEEAQKMLNSIKTRGLNYTQGRFFHILGDTDKGKAVSILIDLYKVELGDVLTVAIGDSPNDIPMLEKVECPVIVQKPDGNYNPRVNIPNLSRASGIGPNGWNKAVLKLIKKNPGVSG